MLKDEGIMILIPLFVSLKTLGQTDKISVFAQEERNTQLSSEFVPD